MMRVLDIPATAERIIVFLKQIMADAGFSRLVVAISGGIDSSTALTLAVAALGAKNVFTLSLPYRDWHTEAELRTAQLLNQLQIPSSNIREMDISPMVDAFINSADLLQYGNNILASDDLTSLRLGNVMARVRMVSLFDYAKKISGLVLGTENKSEHYLGYYTRFGDEASDIEPLRNLYKTEVFKLAEHLGIPQDIREAIPTAGLWPGQTDEGQFGFTYKTADEILYGLYEAKLSTQELMESGLDASAIDQVQLWVTRMAFKHILPWMPPEPVLIPK